MPTLQEALESFSKTLTAYPPKNGQTTHEPNTDGMPTDLTLSGGDSKDTGQALTVKSPSNVTGRELGRIGAIERPRTAEEAATLAEQLVGTLLPPSMDSWLAAQQYRDIMGMDLYPRVEKPEKTPEMVEYISQTVKLLSEITAPAKQRPDELAIVLGKMFAGFNLFMGDAGKIAAQVEVWGEELQEFPLYAIRKAYRWAVRGENKLPTLAAFIVDVKLSVGSNVLARKKFLEGWLKQ